MKSALNFNFHVKCVKSAVHVCCLFTLTLMIRSSWGFSVFDEFRDCWNIIFLQFFERPNLQWTWVFWFYINLINYTTYFISCVKLFKSCLIMYHVILRACVRYKFDACTFPYVPRVQHEVPTTQLQMISTLKILVRLKKKNKVLLQTSIGIKSRFLFVIIFSIDGGDRILDLPLRIVAYSRGTVYG